MKKALITGIAGFAGSHLAEYIISQKKDMEVFGTVLPNLELKNISRFIDKVKILPCDINNKNEVENVIGRVLPDIIFHLAAQSYIHSSWENPEATLQTNIIGQSNIFEAVRTFRNNIDPIILIICSSEEYGYVQKDEVPIKETNDLRPRSPYAVSKVAQDFMGYQYWEAYKIKIIRMRAFNHTGPRRASIFFVSDLAKKIAEIENKLRVPELEIRDLSAIRDFSDVRDIVRGYVMAINTCEPGDVYNICSGKALVLQEILDEFLRLSKVKNIKIIKDPLGTRPTDGGIIIGDNSKFKERSGWNPEIDFLKKTLPDMLEWWRERVSL